MWTYTNTDELYHYGVLGMKWGVRRTDAQLGRRPSKKSDEPERKKKLKKSVAEAITIKKMSDQELRDAVNRMNLEKQYKKLTSESKTSKLGKGLKIVAGAATAMGTVTALYTNGKKLAEIGKPIGEKVIDKIGDFVVKDLATHI